MVNWNSLLSYDTVKIVRVRDCRLGFLHYFAMFCILLYVGGYTIFWQQRYLLTGAPTGSVRLTLKAPSVNYSPQELPYCWLPNQTSYNGYPNFNCTYWDENLALFPAVEDHDMFITTRVNLSDQSLPDHCTLEEPNCKYVQDSLNVYYIPDVERFTVMIDHTMYVPGIADASGRNIHGRLLDLEGNPIEIDPKDKNNRISSDGKADILQVGTLLKAAGVDLDDVAETPNQYGIPVSKRYDGIILLVFIYYSNLVTYDLNYITYDYSVNLIPGAKFTAEQPIQTKSLERRQIWDRHGVRFIFIQTGLVGKFDFQTVLLSLVSGLGLMTAATFLVDILATKILPAKTVYNKFKFEDTHDIDHPLFDQDAQTSGPLDSDPLLPKYSNIQS